VPNFKNIKKEDKVALYVSGGLHLALLAFFLLYKFSLNVSVRPSYMEVKVGKFKMGTQVQHAKVKHKKVAATPHPPKKQPKQPKPKPAKNVKTQKKAAEKDVKPVHSPKQKQKVKSEKLKTPKTKKVNPKKKPAKKKKKKETTPPKKVKKEKKKVQKAAIPPKAQRAKKQKEGAQKSGSKKGNTGKTNGDEGQGSQKKKSAPYNLNIKGINRNPVQQPLPRSISNYNATVTLRFEVTPQGHVVDIIPIHKSGDPRVDREVIQTLKKWQFSRLPANAPQENQTGTITFHFVLH
jgi:protein TonB